MGLSANDPPFKTMSDHDRVRLFDMNAEPVPFIDPKDPATKELKTRFSEYAVGQKPATVTEYVDHFSYARARYRWRVPTSSPRSSSRRSSSAWAARRRWRAGRRRRRSRTR